jgi:hypothetical protein
MKYQISCEIEKKIAAATFNILREVNGEGS